MPRLARRRPVHRVRGPHSQVSPPPAGSALRAEAATGGEAALGFGAGPALRAGCSRLEIGPAGQFAHPAKIIAGRSICHDFQIRQPVQHDERVVRPAAQALRARHERHELRIALPALLQRAPGEIVKELELVAGPGIQCLLPAFARITALRVVGAWAWLPKRPAMTTRVRPWASLCVASSAAVVRGSSLVAWQIAACDPAASLVFERRATPHDRRLKLTKRAGRPER